MAVPATTGQLRTNVADMEIGDYISIRYDVPSNSVVGTFSLLGSYSEPIPSGVEAPINGRLNGNGYHSYLVKVDKGLLISDRVLQHTISWDTLNTGKVIQGKTQSFGDITCTIRSLTGGVAYVDANGGSSTTDLGLGAFPTNNEWDRYIVNFPTELIQSGKTLDDVFHWSGISTWTQDTISSLITVNYSGVTNNQVRVRRGNITLNTWWGNPSTITTTNFGFRPVFAYQE